MNELCEYQNARCNDKNYPGTLIHICGSREATVDKEYLVHCPALYSKYIVVGVETRLRVGQPGARIPTGTTDCSSKTSTPTLRSTQHTLQADPGSFPEG